MNKTQRSRLPETKCPPCSACTHPHARRYSFAHLSSPGVRLEKHLRQSLPEESAVGRDTASTRADVKYIIQPNIPNRCINRMVSLVDVLYGVSFPNYSCQQGGRERGPPERQKVSIVMFMNGALSMPYYYYHHHYYDIV